MRVRSIAIIIIAFGLCPNVFATQLQMCDISEYAMTTELRHSAEFWQEFSLIDPKSSDQIRRFVVEKLKLDPAAVAEKVNKARSSRHVPEAATAKVTLPVRVVEKSRDVQKEKGLVKVSPVARAKYEELLKIFQTEPGDVVRKLNTGGWRVDSYKEMPGHLKVRLDDGARVVFRIVGKTVHIVEAGPAKWH
jgi:hypothetical protein